MSHAPKKVFFLAVGAALVGAALLVFSYLGEPSSSGVTSGNIKLIGEGLLNSASSTQEQSAMPVSQNPQVQSLSKGSGYRTNSLLAEASITSNLRAFVEKAKLQPQNGGLLIARFKLLACKFPMGIKEPQQNAVFMEGSKDSSAMLAAREELLRRCAGFTEADYADIEKLANGRGADPALQAYFELNNAKETTPIEQLIPHLQTLHRLGLLELAPRTFFATNLPRGDGLPPKQTWYFEGKPNGGASEFVFQRAFSAWERSVANGQQGRMQADLYLCAEKGFCEGDGLAQVLYDIPSDGNTRREIVSMYGRLKETLEAGRFQAFAPPKGNG